MKRLGKCLAALTACLLLASCASGRKQEGKQVVTVDPRKTPEINGGIFEGYIDMQVRDRRVLEEIISHLSRIEGIQDVMRMDI